MAVTIVRTPWVDDDGTGTTGTVINNAVKTALYNEIDGALAKVPQLAGGNAWTGNQLITGALVVTGSGSFVQSVPAGGHTVTIQNTAAGAAATTRLQIGNDVDSALMLIMSLSSTYTPAGYAQANGSVFYQGGAGGVAFVAANAAGSIRFYTGGGIERFRATATGALWFNTQAALWTNPAQVEIASAAGPVMTLALTGVTTGNLIVFANNTQGLAGYITQPSATTVQYVTTSDARLKTDEGRATDVTALRAVVVHDFTWNSDGIRARGVFAQEAHDVFPSAVAVGTDEITEHGDLARPWGTDYSKFVPDLIVGWQQHDADLADLRAQLATLKGSH